MDRLGLAQLLDVPVRQLSLGERMRGEVAAALVHRPRLLVLDEPTIGLDMISKERLRHFLLAERAEFGTTLLLTTHDMGDIERLCERVLVVDHGRLVFDGTLIGPRCSGWHCSACLSSTCRSRSPDLHVGGGDAYRKRARRSAAAIRVQSAADHRCPGTGGSQCQKRR